MKYSQVAKVYAGSLLEISSENKSLDETQEELASVVKLLTSDESSWEFLSSPVFKLEDRMNVIDKSFKGNVSEVMYNFLGVLMNHDRMEILPEVLDEFKAGVDLAKGRIRAKLTTGKDMDADSIKTIQKTLEEKFKAECVLESEVNEDLIGGFTIRFNDMLIDRSIKNELANIKQHLLQSNLPIEAISL